jgi:hypothetical protein
MGRNAIGNNNNNNNSNNNNNNNNNNNSLPSTIRMMRWEGLVARLERY